MTDELITYGWLSANGFHKLQRHERQPTDHCRRCIGMETIGEKFMVASEDLCIDVCPDRFPEPTYWFVWVTKAYSQNNFPSQWIAVRFMRSTSEIVLLYEGLTGRTFGPPSWRTKDLGQPLF